MAVELVLERFLSSVGSRFIKERDTSLTRIVFRSADVMSESCREGCVLGVEGFGSAQHDRGMAPQRPTSTLTFPMESGMVWVMFVFREQR